MHEAALAVICAYTDNDFVPSASVTVTFLVGASFSQSTAKGRINLRLDVRNSNKVSTVDRKIPYRQCDEEVSSLAIPLLVLQPVSFFHKE